MSCNEMKEKFPDFLIGELNIKEKTIIKKHLFSCTKCRKEFENLNEIWTKLGILPEEQPSESLRNNFYTMLESYRAGSEHFEKTKSQGDIAGYRKRSFNKIFEKLWPRRSAYQFALAIIFILFGFIIGYFSQFENNGRTERIELRQEVRSLRQSAALAMLKQRSPSDRIRGVSFSSRVKNPDKNTLIALLDTLNNDANVNVRLSAVDALYLFSDIPMVKEGLVNSLSIQESPLVQIALIDLIVEIKKKKAVKSLKELIKKQKLNPEVKKQAELSIQELI